MDLISIDAACGRVSSASLIAAAAADCEIRAATNAPTAIDDRMQVYTHDDDDDDVYIAEWQPEGRRSRRGNFCSPLFLSSVFGTNDDNEVEDVRKTRGSDVEEEER